MTDRRDDGAEDYGTDGTDGDIDSRYRPGDRPGRNRAKQTDRLSRERVAERT